MQIERAEQQRVLPTAGYFGEKLLLLAPEAARPGGRSNGAAAGTAGIHSCLGGYAADSVPGHRAETARRCEHGRRCGAAAVDSVAMIDLSKVRNYYMACGYTDLRLGIDGLAAIVTQQFGGHLNEESLFLFCGRRADRMKALYWSGDGYVLLHKRLSNGRFQWPRSETELRLLDPQSFR